MYYSRDYYTEGDIMINIPGLDEPTEAFRTYYRCVVDPTFNCPLGPAMTNAVPEPGTLSLLSIGCLWLLQRRKLL